MSDSPATSVLQQFVERSRRLYSLPAIALEVIELTGQPAIDTRALKDCIEKDPALTTRILRVVNSSLFGLSRPVSDLQQALALLGIKPLKMLVLGFSLPKELLEDVEADALRHYWQHAVIKSVACRLLSERVWNTPGDEAFIAGLLQDIGQLVLIQDLGPPYLRFLEHVRSQQGPLLERELETLGFDHTVLSSKLLQHWRLPATIAAAVAVPPDVDQILMLPADRRALPQILHLAELVAQLIERPCPEALQRLLDTAARYRSLTYDALQNLAATLQTQVEQLSDALALDLPSGPPYTDLLRTAHERLADVAAEAAVELASLTVERRVLDETRELRDQLQFALATPTNPRDPNAVRNRAMHGPTPVSPHLVRSDPPANERSEPAWPAPPSASSQPLTASNDPGLLGRVVSAIAHGRVARCPVSLSLLQVDHWASVVLQQGPQHAIELLRLLEEAVSRWTNQRGSCLAVGEAQFALVWADCDRREAVELVRQLLDAIKTWQPAGDGSSAELTLTAGLATLTLPPKNFRPQDLIDAARRCLSGALLSGGDSFKSIEF